MFKMIPWIIATSCLTSIIISLFFYVLMLRPHIGTVDVLSVTNEFIRQEVQKNHSQSDKEAAIKLFSHNLEQALQQLAISKSLILLPREAVIQGSRDYTETLKSMLSESLAS